MSGSHTPQQGLQHELESLLATLMMDTQLTTVHSNLDRLEAALEADTGTGDAGLTPHEVTELRSAIELLRGGRSCAAVSSLLAVRSALGSG